MNRRNSRNGVIARSATMVTCSIVVTLWACSAHAELPGYVILTTTGIVAQSSQLTNFTATKTARKFDVSVIVNTPTNAGGWGGGTGDTAAENIRAWLVNNYQAMSIEYVLLVGNPNPADGDMPMKKCFPKNAADTNNFWPTDAYYANLSANWDLNTNGFCGEWADIDSNNCPWAYDVAVGRIPYYGSTSDLDSILTKIMCYEASTNVAWRKNALLAMTTQYPSGYNNDSSADWIVANVLNPSRWTPKRYHGSVWNWIWYGGSAMDVWTDSLFGAVFWATDGGASFAAAVMNVSDVEMLDNDHPAFIFQGCCENAWPEITNNLAYSLLRHGAVATIGGTRTTVTYNDQPNPQRHPDYSPGFMIFYAQNFILYRLSAGEALCLHRAGNAPSSSDAWINYLSYTLYGCPATSPYRPFAGPIWMF